MDSSTRNDLLSWWQIQHFKLQVEDSSPSDKADCLRTLLSSTNYAGAASIISEQSVFSSCMQLADKYADIVDSPLDKNGVDNYAEGALSLSAGNKNESNDWKTSLTIDKLKSLKCVQNLMQAAKESHNAMYPPGYKTDIPIDKNTRIIDSNRSVQSSTSNQSTVFKSTNAGSFTYDNDPSKRHDRMLNAKPSTSKSDFSAFGQDNGAGSRNKRKFDHESEQRGAGSSSMISAVTDSVFKGKGPSIQEPLDDDTSRPYESDFRTAREQLVIENQKKYGKTSNQQVSTTAYGNNKKTLGLRRGRGFVPPVLNRDNEDSDEGGMTIRKTSSNKSSKATEEPVDERLKNIDEKMVEMIMSEIMDHGPSVSWDDIAGLEFAKNTIKEIVVWPMLRPDIFTGLRGPPKGLLLFGPPGTGKTLIGKCIASQSKSTFFSISASSLTSKWVGEGEKMVRALFAVARCEQPSVIFIDEIDSLLSQRSDSEHESSRRIKTEFLVQLDGATTSADDRILVVGATNRPHELDEAARRRFVKRLYIPLPEGAARIKIVDSLMLQQSHVLSEQELQKICDKTDGYSGADMANLCREAALGPIRSISFSDIQNISADQVRPIVYTDFEKALHQVRASVTESDLHLYLDWNKKFGSWSI